MISIIWWLSFFNNFVRIWWSLWLNGRKSCCMKGKWSKSLKCLDGVLNWEGFELYFSEKLLDQKMLSSVLPRRWGRTWRSRVWFPLKNSGLKGARWTNVYPCWSFFLAVSVIFEASSIPVVVSCLQKHSFWSSLVIVAVKTVGSRCFREPRHFPEMCLSILLNSLSSRVHWKLFCLFRAL